MENQEEKISLLELVWRLSYQVTASPTADRSDISEDGSCFIIRYHDKDILVTADHILHALDFGEGLRGNEERYISILTNISDKATCQTLFATIGGFISYTTFKDVDTFKEYAEAEDVKKVIPNDMPDLAFAKYENPKRLPFITHELLDAQHQLLVPAGLQKGIITQEMFSSIPENQDEQYIVMGAVHNMTQNNTWIRCNAIHCGLRYKETMPDGVVALSVPTPIVIKDWEALSGSPVFNYHGDFVGMLIRVADGIYNHALIMPINTILRYIDMAIGAEQL